MRKWVPDSVISAQVVGGCLINILILKNSESARCAVYLLGWRVESSGVASALPCSGLGDLGAWELPLGISSLPRQPLHCSPVSSCPVPALPSPVRMCYWTQCHMFLISLFGPKSLVPEFGRDTHCKFCLPPVHYSPKW